MQDGAYSGNEGTYSGYAALPTPAAVGLAGADRVLTPEVYNAAPDSDPDYASGPLPFGGVSSRVVPFALRMRVNFAFAAVVLPGGIGCVRKRMPLPPNTSS